MIDTWLLATLCLLLLTDRGTRTRSVDKDPV